jgi:hypothetical protein
MNSNMTQIPLVFRSKLKRGTKFSIEKISSTSTTSSAIASVSKVATESAITPAVAKRKRTLEDATLTKALAAVELQPSKDDHGYLASSSICNRYGSYCIFYIRSYQWRNCNIQEQKSRYSICYTGHENTYAYESDRSLSGGRTRGRCGK